MDAANLTYQPQRYPLNLQGLFYHPANCPNKTSSGVTKNKDCEVIYQPTLTIYGS